MTTLTALAHPGRPVRHALSTRHHHHGWWWKTLVAGLAL